MTTQEELRIAAKKAETENDLYDVADRFAREIMHSDPAFWGIDRFQSGYGTWKVRINFANEYHYGRQLAELLVRNTASIVTHDEDKTFDMEDFLDEIRDVCYDLAVEYKGEDDEEGGNNE